MFINQRIIERKQESIGITFALTVESYGPQELRIALSSSASRCGPYNNLPGLVIQNSWHKQAG